MEADYGVFFLSAYQRGLIEQVTAKTSGLPAVASCATQTQASEESCSLRPGALPQLLAPQHGTSLKAAPHVASPAAAAPRTQLAPHSSCQPGSHLKEESVSPVHLSRCSTQTPSGNDLQLSADSCRVALAETEGPAPANASEELNSQCSPVRIPVRLALTAEDTQRLEERVSAHLDSFFERQESWQLIAEVWPSFRRNSLKRLGYKTSYLPSFRVELPKPHPGVQYRKTKCLHDKVMRYEINGNIVEGSVEDGGKWLHTEYGYLPIKVGEFVILHRQTTLPVGPDSKQSNGHDWSLCCKNLSRLSM